MSTALVWLRRDLRLADNAALNAALERHEQVLPVFIHDPDAESPWSPGGASRWWLHHSLAALDQALRGIGGGLLLRQGASLPVLCELARSTGAAAVYWNRLYEPAFVERDRHVKEALRAEGLTAESFNAALLFEPWSLKTQGGEPYRVFTPFWRSASLRLAEQLASGRAPVHAPTRVALPELLPNSLPLAGLGLLPRISWDAGFYEAWTPGEAGALARLERFAEESAGRYRERRDLPAVDATSCLSAALHFGEVSPLQLVARMERLTAAESAAGVHAGADTVSCDSKRVREAPDWRAPAPTSLRSGTVSHANAEWYVRELGWREFAHHLLFHHPRTPEVPMIEKFAAFPWRPLREYALDLAAWQRGRTGVPIVDAGMRQLWHTGWMHNRVRMIVASVLTKNLLIPWQEGARWFWDTLVDASLANNTQGWQWSAGCGADAAPYFRIFNPVLQSQRFDADGAYIRRWVPELKLVPSDAIHAPWQAKSGVLSAAGVSLGRNYPVPIVDLAKSRERALAAYQHIKSEA